MPAVVAPRFSALSRLSLVCSDASGIPNAWEGGSG